MAHMKFELTVGRLVRRSVIRALREAALVTGVETFSYDEDKGWLDSHYICKAEGDDNAIVRFRDYYLALMREFDDETRKVATWSVIPDDDGPVDVDHWMTFPAGMTLKQINAKCRQCNRPPVGRWVTVFPDDDGPPDIQHIRIIATLRTGVTLEQVNTELRQCSRPAVIREGWLVEEDY